MMQPTMKKYYVKILYVWNDFDGHSHTGSLEVNVVAKNKESAINKAKKEIPRGGHFIKAQ